MPELSTREKEIAAAIWRCFLANDSPKIDYEALARLANINTAKTASNTWGAFKKKLMEAEDPTKVDLTERDLLVARVAWLCVDAGNIPKINTALMVEMGLFKTAKKKADSDKTASNTWWSIKKKLQAEVDGNSAADGNKAIADPSTPGQSATPKTVKRKATASAQGASDASPSAKKPRKARKTKASTQAKEEASETAETDAQELPVENTKAPVAFPAYVDGAVFAPAI